MPNEPQNQHNAPQIQDDFLDDEPIFIHPVGLGATLQNIHANNRRDYGAWTLDDWNNKEIKQGQIIMKRANSAILDDLKELIGPFHPVGIGSVLYHFADRDGVVYELPEYINEEDSRIERKTEGSQFYFNEENLVERAGNDPYQVAGLDTASVKWVLEEPKEMEADQKAALVEFLKRGVEKKELPIFVCVPKAEGSVMKAVPDQVKFMGVYKLNVQASLIYGHIVWDWVSDSMTVKLP